MPFTTELTTLRPRFIPRTLVRAPDADRRSRPLVPGRAPRARAARERARGGTPSQPPRGRRAPRAPRPSHEQRERADRDEDRRRNVFRGPPARAADERADGGPLARRRLVAPDERSPRRVAERTGAEEARDGRPDVPRPPDAAPLARADARAPGDDRHLHDLGLRPAMPPG